MLVAALPVKSGAKDGHEGYDITGELFFKAFDRRVFKNFDGREHLPADLPYQAHAEPQKPVLVNHRKSAHFAVKPCTKQLSQAGFGAVETRPDVFNDLIAAGFSKTGRLTLEVVFLIM